MAASFNENGSVLQIIGNIGLIWIVNKLIVDHLPSFFKCKEHSSYPFGLLRSVDVPIGDFDKCKKEYQKHAEENNYPNPFDKFYVDGMNICAGEAGKGHCNVRFI